ncbi:hypothetical protein JOF53_008167 [Crossiella equi]|uniref:Uncharacterized protein n=1 Tax=Crossiella equi TaxID=130796 RepID=A0ABS5ARV9_9PSEU|nr:DUF5994 family protein [Crossiella equi]MBP2479295.1 hypothetical protein [Crossiella equi]
MADHPFRTGDRHTAAPAEKCRLRLKPDSPASGYVDGAWWPRSTDPGSEFPALARALRTRLGAVSRISFNLDAWQPTQRRMSVDGRRLGVDGYRTFQPNTVGLTVAGQRSVSLLVIPAGATEAQAEAVLADAADPRILLAVPDILKSNGIPPDVTGAGSVPRPR